MENASELPACDLALTPGGLLELARCFGVTGTPLVPLVGAGSAAPGWTEDDRQTLRTAGLLQGESTVDPTLGSVLSALAASRAFGRVRVGLVRPELDAVVHHTPAGPLSLSSRDGGVRLRTQPVVEDLVLAVAELTGTSVLRPVTLDVSLPAEGAACLVAALDLGRRAILEALVQDRDPLPPTLTPEALGQWLSRPPGRPQWLTPRYLQGRDAGALGAAAAVRQGLGQLVDAGLVEGAVTALRAGAALMDAVAALAILDQAVILEAGRVGDSGSPMTTAIGAVRGAGSATLVWESGPDGSVRFAGASPAGLLSMTADLLGNPEALSVGGAAEGSDPGAEASARFCPGCGTEARAGDRFCRSCGRAFA
jgi:hypothetical protein